MKSFKEYLECDNKISSLLDGNQLIMFLCKDDNIFGAPEDSRLVFARMKGDEEFSDEWRKQAKFVVLDLLKSLSGEPKQVMLGMDDLPQLKIIQRDDVVKKLMRLQ